MKLIIVFLLASMSVSGQVPQAKYDSLLNVTLTYKHQRDSLKIKALAYGFTLRSIRQKCDIVGRKPSQLKFLRGWVLRDLRGVKL